MKRRRKLSVLIAILIIVFSSQILFAASGKIKGKVVDKLTGKALPSANLFLKGTSIGTSTDLWGNYVLLNVPFGTYTLVASYIGYNTVEFPVRLTVTGDVVQNVEMEGVTLTGEEVTVTAQAVGQKAAINQQLASKNIVNVVSSARIQELPDANAAESIGRLPGVSLIRSGGQATKVVIRGISPEYNQITINGVPIQSNEGGGNSGGGRGIDMRMISSNMLNEIEVFKTSTPDMDAAVLGGTVNLGIRKASKYLGESPFGVSWMPAVTMKAQGGYISLTNEYNNYKFDVSLEKRFLENRLGVYVQGIVQQQNYTSNRLNASYTQIAKTINPDSLALTSLNLYFLPREEKRYNGTVTLDYDIRNGNIAFTNIFSQSRSDSKYFQQNYNYERGGNNIHYYANHSPNKINLVTNILNYNQKTPLVDIDATVSHSYSENITPDSYTNTFEQLSVGTNQIDDKLPPVELASLAHELVSFEDLELRNVSTWDRFTSQREYRGAIDLSREFNIAEWLSLEVKTGGMYSSTDRTHDNNRGYGSVWFGEIGERIVEQYPWLTEDWDISGETNARLYITPFMDPDMNIGTFMKGDYKFDNKLNMDYMERIKEIVVDYGNNLDAAPTGGAGAWVPNMFGNQADDYSGTEERSAGYIMGTFQIGRSLSLMAGARYQSLTTSYRANRFYNASVSNPYPNELPHIDTLVTKTHGYWLPGFNVKFSPLSWLSVRAAYTNTLGYQGYTSLIPRIQVYSGGPSVTWNNVNLKPIRSENIDLQVSVYSNDLGLFTLGGFRKNIDDFVFWQDTYINDPEEYEGLHDVADYPNLNVKGYRLGTYYNNPYQVLVWGLEADWQTHFWYLPSILSGLVLNVNYTHTFSEAKYPQTVVGNSGFPFFQPTYTDTLYTDQLINQPDDIVNISVGYDYKGFSILLSSIYQSSIFNSTNFWNALRQDKDEYLRLDLVAKQKVPRYNMEVFLNLNNLNGANDTYLIRGNGYRVADESYGLTAELGIRKQF